MRLIRRHTSVGIDRLASPVVHPDGRVLAAASPNWLSFFDLETGAELAALRLPTLNASRWNRFDRFAFPSTVPMGQDAPRMQEGWVSDGPSGLLWWPAEYAKGQPDLLKVGPPQRLAEYTHDRTASAENGRLLLGRYRDAVHMQDRARPGVRLVLGPQFDVRDMGLSTDGRWA